MKSVPTRNILMAALVLTGFGPILLHGEEVPAAPETPAAAVQAAQPLTWEECIRLTVTNSPALEASRQGVMNAEAVKKGSSSSLYPQIKAALTGERSGSQRLLSTPGQPATTSYSTQYQAQLSLQQTLFDGFKTKGNIDQARAELSLAFASLDSEKALVSYELKSAFAQLLYAQELVTITANVVKIRADNARMIRLLYNGGSEDKGALMLSDANLQSANYELEQARRNQEVSARQLQNVIGRDLPEPLVAAGTLEIPQLPARPDFKKLAVQTPAYLQQTARTNAAAAGVTIAQSGWYPAVSASASGYRSGSGLLPEENQGWSAGVSVSYDIFNGGSTYFNVRAARASLMQQLATLRSTANDNELALARDFKTLVDAAGSVAVQEALFKATALRYQVAEAKYRNGLSSFQDFNTITDSYINQQKAFLAARRDAVIAEANWEQSVGTGAIP